MEPKGENGRVQSWSWLNFQQQERCSEHPSLVTSHPGPLICQKTSSSLFQAAAGPIPGLDWSPKVDNKTGRISVWGQCRWMKAVTCRTPPPADLHLNDTAGMTQVTWRKRNCLIQPWTHSHSSWFNHVIQNFINTKAVTKTQLQRCPWPCFDLFVLNLFATSHKKKVRKNSCVAEHKPVFVGKTKLKINKSPDWCQSDAPVTDAAHRCENSRKTHLILSSKCQAGPRGSMCRRPLKPGVLYSKKVVWPTATARLSGGEWGGSRQADRGQPTRAGGRDPDPEDIKTRHRVPSTHTHTLAQTHAHWWSWMKSSLQPERVHPRSPAHWSQHQIKLCVERSQGFKKMLFFEICFSLLSSVRLKVAKITIMIKEISWLEASRLILMPSAGSTGWDLSALGRLVRHGSDSSRSYTMLLVCAVNAAVLIIQTHDGTEGGKYNYRTLKCHSKDTKICHFNN